MSGELLDLVVGFDPALKQRVVERIQLVIIQSFEADRSRMTRSEVTRRFRMLEVSIRELRKEHEWAFERILDVLPHALRCSLDGVSWDPTLYRNVWSA